MADVGRPTKMTPEALKKLEEAFAIGCSDLEACFYADISHQTLYTYQKSHPKFLERKRELKERPVLLARQKVVSEIEKDTKNAQWYLEKKKSDEFSGREVVEHTADDDIKSVLRKLLNVRSGDSSGDGKDPIPKSE